LGRRAENLKKAAAPCSLPFLLCLKVSLACSL
jgi:hypothetical protein